MNERIKRLLILSLLLIPSIIFASTENNTPMYIFVLIWSGALSIPYYTTIFKPIAKSISEKNASIIALLLFIIRIIILVILAYNEVVVELFVDFIILIIATLVCRVIQIDKKISEGKVLSQVKNEANTISTPTNNVELKCTKCGGVLKIGDKFCKLCGTAVNNVAEVKVPQAKVVVSYSSFAPIYKLSEDKLIENFIEKEMSKLGIENNKKLIPKDIVKRMNILNIIFAALVFVFMVMIFLHYPIYAYVIGLIILLVFAIIKGRYNIVKYLNKQVKARPSEKISNVVMSVKNDLVPNNVRTSMLIYLFVAIFIPLVIFINPKIIYEKVDGGYAVRYYAFGLNNYRNVTIPETYKGEKIVSLRGNTFSNMPFLESVTLPDSIVEIRGEAFMNCVNLKNVNMPSNLEYLGGGAFKNATSIETIELPDKLNYLGGEAFMNATSLEHIYLSKSLTEIRGNTFENCTSLVSIEIPDNVTRIGAHAFYGDNLLSSVIISKDSKLVEIGSSAFRRCYNLNEITIPSSTSVNERAFKESPTLVHRY